MQTLKKKAKLIIMQLLKINIHQAPEYKNAQIVQLEGDFDGSDDEHLESIQQLLEQCAAESKVVFDLTSLNYLNSFAVSKMVEWQKRAEAKQVKIVLVKPNNHIRDIFMVLGVDSLFTIYDNFESLK